MKLKLQGRMIAFILLPALLGLCILAGMGYSSSARAIYNQINKDAPVVLGTLKIGIENFFTTLRRGMYIPVDNQRVVHFLEARKAGIGGSELKPYFEGGNEALKYYIEVTKALNTCGVVVQDGTVVLHRVLGRAEPGNLLGKNMGDRPYIKAGLEGREGLGTYKSRATGETTTIVSLPVIRDGEVLGVFYAGMDNITLSKNILGAVQLGEFGAAYIYNAQGEAIMHSDSSLIGTIHMSEPHVQEMLRKKNGSLEYVNKDGFTKIVYFEEMPGVHWVVCAELDKNEIMKPAHELLFHVCLLVLVLALAVGSIIFFTARGIVRPLAISSGLVAHVAKGEMELSPEERNAIEKAERRGDELSVMAAGIRDMVKSISDLLQESEHKTQEALKATEEARAATARAEEAAQRAENAKREGMHAAASQLEEVVGIITSASTQLSAQIDQSDRSASESAQRLAEAATAMNEMNATVQEVARNASEASRMSAETRSKAEQGATVVQQAVDGIEKVQEVAEVLRNDMQQLNEHARSISAIMGVISDIADQTNLLALNAAIEAARAGEAGRGFAVVADEVRKLAEKTMASTSEVGSAINAIQHSTTKSMEGVDKAVSQIGQATELSNQSGLALQEIVADAETTADEVRAIAAASEQQSAASEEINQSIVQVNDMSGKTAEAMREATQAVAALAEQSRRLEALVEDMKRQ
ncbi:methyl-accepting chemotaxis protein [uncultured Desulfovibrio sp.]|uniref:Cache 3/Cache 2 fusion domain-containing protein n=1 Tax=Candidatus Desulfovibrio intestinavium TaxID=2838534 RepID=A0A9D2HLV1_9BACT|nr:methyl-accepting chemotaxis protein [uncultured Desulfovibrio sp.]HJA78234.1 Cache 3/Cache 2 fusion domain-containing protein [Candidatus Desulfovibrio intestinavium]